MNNKGFTLIEIILVIAILGILVSLFIPNFGKTQLTSRVAAHNANMKMIKSAGAMYLLDNPLKSGDLINESDLVKYLDKDVEFKIDDVVIKHIGEKEIIVKVDDDGDIIVLPGEVKLEDDKIVLVTRNKNYD